MTALALKVTPDATDKLIAAKAQFKAKAGLSLLFPLVFKLILRMLPWIIEMLIPLVLEHSKTTEDQSFPVPEPYLAEEQ
jgi:hypothetical protein